MNLYFDNAATTALDPEVLEAMVPHFLREYANPSSNHRAGRQAREAVEAARRTVAELLGALPGEIVFTSGATESNHLALTGSLPPFGLRHFISSPLEHQAVLQPLLALERAGRARVHYVVLDERGRVDYDHLEGLLDRYPSALVSLMHANNEVGNLLDLERVARLAAEQGALFHSDTVQTVGRFRFDLRTTPIQFLVGSAHKFHGPKGVGFLYVRRGTALQAVTKGGSQERGLRGGTENVAGIVGLAKAMEIAHRDLTATQAQLRTLKTYLKDRLLQLHRGVSFNGTSRSLEESLSTILSVSFPPLPLGGSLLDSLDAAGLSVSGGSACSSKSQKGSHVLERLGVEAGRQTLRISLSRSHTLGDIDHLVEVIRRSYEGMASKKPVPNGVALVHRATP